MLFFNIDLYMFDKINLLLLLPLSLYLVDMHDKRSFIFILYHGFRIVNLEQVYDIVYYHIGLLHLHSI